MRVSLPLCSDPKKQIDTFVAVQSRDKHFRRNTHVPHGSSFHAQHRFHWTFLRARTRDPWHRCCSLPGS
jgi:hypothetical protein